MKIIVQRTDKTLDGTFGKLSIDSDPFTCITCERTRVEILPGTYNMEFTYSPKFNRIMPLIDVPERDGVRIHPANFPCQLDGCIAVGDIRDQDSVDNSKVTFNKLYSIIDGKKGLTIEVRDIG